MSRFPVTITVDPEKKTCGGCFVRVFIPDGDKDFCQAFGEVLGTKPLGKVLRCAACLAAEAAHKEGGG